MLEELERIPPHGAHCRKVYCVIWQHREQQLQLSPLQIHCVSSKSSLLASWLAKDKASFMQEGSAGYENPLAVRPGSMPYSQLRASSHIAKEMEILLAGTRSMMQFTVQGATEVKFTASS